MPPTTTATTLLAGMSVAISVASLVLSYRTWRRQREEMIHESVRTHSVDTKSEAEREEQTKVLAARQLAGLPKPLAPMSAITEEEELSVEEESSAAILELKQALEGIRTSKSALDKSESALLSQLTNLSSDSSPETTNHHLTLAALNGLQYHLVKYDAAIVELRAKVNGMDGKTEPTPASAPSDCDSTTTTQTPQRVRATLENQVLANSKGLTVQPIGVIRSIYRLCVGTPRQGLLVPNARGRIELALPTDAAMDCVQELERFSHIWILFVFHLNTLAKNTAVKPKIAPPALGGQKVGVLATRSPHRFNPIGITLAKLDRIEIKDKKAAKSQGGARVVLHISGLDLVDGTPVVDVKPYVPVYDSVPDEVRLPPWVSEGLATRRQVTISEAARSELQTILASRNKALQFYGPHTYKNESNEDALENMLACITDVLAMDVRSSWQTKKARKGKSQAERANRLKNKQGETDNDNNTSATCTQQLDNLLLHYTVTESTKAQRAESEGSGAEDQVYVTSIQPLQQHK